MESDSSAVAAVIAAPRSAHQGKSEGTTISTIEELTDASLQIQGRLKESAKSDV